MRKQKPSKLEEVERVFLETIKEQNMIPLFQRGVLCALSGGADSVMLLLLMHRLQQTEHGGFPLAAVHVHHMIRDGEADRDANFCRALCSNLGLPFFLKYCDVPSGAAKKGVGIEETARYMRYTVFEEMMDEPQRGLSFGCTVTAHNATDQLETVLFRLTRGSGLRGLSGIPYVRDRYARPLLRVPKADIVEALNETAVAYVNDSTNTDCHYARNYIRHEILPRLEELHPEAETAIVRVCENLRLDSDCLEQLACDFIEKFSVEGEVEVQSLLGLHEAVLTRVIVQLYRNYTDKPEIMPESVHLKKTVALLRQEKDFCVNYPASIILRVENGRLCFDNEGREQAEGEWEMPLRLGENILPQGCGKLYIYEFSNAEFANLSQNVYKLSIHAELNSDKISGGLYARGRLAGDCYRYGGRTRRLKQLYHDAGLSAEKRRTTPIVCDENGILWVPGFRVRDGASEECRDLAVVYYPTTG